MVSTILFCDIVNEFMVDGEVLTVEPLTSGPVSYTHLLTLIARRMILETVERARALNITLSIDDTVTQHFAERTHQEKDGARPLRRMIDSEITNQVADAYLCGRLSNGAAAQITVKNGEISLIH